MCAGPELLATTRLSLELGRWLVAEAGVYLTRDHRPYRKLRRDLPHDRRRRPPSAARHRLPARARPRQFPDRGRQPVRCAARRAGDGHRLPRDPERRVRRRSHAPACRARRPDRDLRAGAYGLTASPQAWESRPAGARAARLGVDRLDEIEAVGRRVEAERGAVARFQRLLACPRAAIARGRPAPGSRPSSAPGDGGSCAPPPRRGFPRRCGDVQPVERLHRAVRLALGRAEGGEVVAPDEMLRALAHRLDVEGQGDVPYAPRVERRRRPAVEDAVEIAPPDAGEARVPVVGDGSTSSTETGGGEPARSTLRAADVRSVTS